MLSVWKKKRWGFFVKNCGSYGVVKKSQFFAFFAFWAQIGGAQPKPPIFRNFKMPYDKQFLIFFDDSNAKSSKTSVYNRNNFLHRLKKNLHVFFRVFDFLYCWCFFVTNTVACFHVRNCIGLYMAKKSSKIISCHISIFLRENDNRYGFPKPSG